MGAIEVKAYIHVRAPEYDEYEGLGGFIAIADGMTGNFDISTVGDGSVGTRRDWAVALRALHMICKRDTRDGAKDGSGQGVSGIIVGETEGQVSRQTRISTRLQRAWGDLVSTTWGLELVALIQGSFLPVMTRTMFNVDVSTAGNNINTSGGGDLVL